MKFAIFFMGLLSFTASTLAVSRISNVAARGAITTPATLTQDIEEISRVVPMKVILKLITRYLLNDAEFQAVVRTLNSYNAFIVRMRFRSQPEVMMFQSWVRSQLMLSGDSIELDESMELKIFNSSPYWSNSVFGWQGFLNELISYYPQDLIRSHIDMKISQNGVFAQFWARLKALKPVYERVIGFPESQRLISELQGLGVDTNQLDQLIRNLFDWQNTGVLPAAKAVVPVASQSLRSVPVMG